MSTYEFDDLWREFNQDLLNYIQSKVGNSHDAEDILQDVSIKIYKNIDNLEDKKALKSWLYRITKNTIIDFYKKKKAIVVDPETLTYIEEEDDTQDNMNSEISNCLKHMLFDIPDKYKAVYDMYENKEMKHKEIVEALDISLSTSKVRLKRAKEMFKKRLLDCCDFQVDQYGNVIDYKRKNSCKKCDVKC